MAADNPRNNSRRKPTKRAAARPATRADSHYSKLTRTSTMGSTERRSGTGSGRPETRRSGTRPANGAKRHPKLTRATGASRGGRPITGYKSLSSDAQRRVYGNRAPRRPRTGNTAALLVGLTVIAAFIGGGILFWTHRSVSLTVNGSPEKIRIGTTLEGLYEELAISTKAGNYIAVDGEVIEEEKGYAFSASVDGKALSRRQTNEYRIHGGEHSEFSDGGDRMEKYDTEYRDVQPKLVFEGSWGSVSFVKQWGKAGRLEMRTGKESGRTAEGKWIEEMQDCIVTTKNVEPADGIKLVALTFDDGPASTYTEEYLRILDEHDAKATFFNLSENEEELPELARKVAESGNQICSHTYRHQQLSTLGKEDLLLEINSAHDSILNVAGVDTTIIRPPYGDFNQNCWLLSGGTISASVIWNQDSLDWSLPGSDAIVQNALAGVQSGSVILMHDGGGDRSQDLDALPQIIERLQADGYQLVTLSELMASDPQIPAEVAAGNASMPEGAVWPTEIGEASQTEA